MQYLLFIHGNTKSTPSPEEWTAFFTQARESGLFRGGSELGRRELIGDPTHAASSAHITGFMRFDADDRQPLIDLLQSHPVVLHGGTVELCEMPTS